VLTIASFLGAVPFCLFVCLIVCIYLFTRCVARSSGLVFSARVCFNDDIDPLCRCAVRCARVCRAWLGGGSRRGLRLRLGARDAKFRTRSSSPRTCWTQTMKSHPRQGIGSSCTIRVRRNRSISPDGLSRIGARSGCERNETPRDSQSTSLKFQRPPTPLEPKSFAILARDEMQFRKAYADREVAIKALIRGSFRFGLSGKGETLSLIDATNSTSLRARVR
jgi:hypothetical protein